MDSGEIIKRFNITHGYSNADVLFVRRLRKLNLSEDQVAEVLQILDAICPFCMDQEHPCHCENDD